MTVIERSTGIDAPVSEVWPVFADFGRVADWHPYFESAALDDPATPSGVGASRLCEFGPRLAIRETVREWTDGERMVIGIDFVRGLAPPIADLEAAVRTTATGAKSTELALTLEYRPKWGPVGRILDGLFIRRMYEGVFDDMLAAAKRYVETGEPSEPIAMLGSGRKL